MVKGLAAFCIVAAVQVCSAYEDAIPVFRQSRGFGDISSHIVSGETATRGQFPHQAGIFIDGRLFCGGSLISENWVLTAARCVNGYFWWKVVLGAQEINDSDEPGHVTVFSREAFSHEKFERKTRSNDVGVIKLPKDVPLNNNINIIALPPRSWKDQNLTGKQVRVSGWGKTSDTSENSPLLQFVDLNLISTEECQAVHGDMITKARYCCSGADGKSPCPGDDGGALTIGSGKNLTHLGIVSYFSSKGCTARLPSVYTATPHFVDWISNITGIVVNDF